MFLKVIPKIFRRTRASSTVAPASLPEDISVLREALRGQSVGLIAGSGAFPRTFIKEAKRYDCAVYLVCHEQETDPALASEAQAVEWVKVGQLGKMIAFFRKHQVGSIAMAGAINRVRLFGNVKLDARGAAMIFRVGSMKDDLIMRGIAEEFEKEGIAMLPCTVFLAEQLVAEGVLSKRAPSKEEYADIAIGRNALLAMSSEHIGQTVVVRDGVVVAVEAVEGTDRCILRGGELGGKGTVIVKCAKTVQDMRFDVPTIGVATIETMAQAGAKVLAVEAQRTLMLEPQELIALADKKGIAVLGIPSLLSHER